MKDFDSKDFGNFLKGLGSSNKYLLKLQPGVVYVSVQMETATIAENWIFKHILIFVVFS